MTKGSSCQFSCFNLHILMWYKSHCIRTRQNMTENVLDYQGCFWFCIWHEECRLSRQAFAFYRAAFREKLVYHHRVVNEADSCLLIRHSGSEPRESRHTKQHLQSTCTERKRKSRPLVHMLLTNILQESIIIPFTQVWVFFLVSSFEGNANWIHSNLYLRTEKW